MVAARMSRSTLSPAISHPGLVDLAEHRVRGRLAVGEVEVARLRPPSVSIRVISICGLSVGTKIIDRPSCLVSPLPVRQTASTWSEMWALEQRPSAR